MDGCIQKHQDPLDSHEHIAAEPRTTKTESLLSSSDRQSFHCPLQNHHSSLGSAGYPPPQSTVLEHDEISESEQGCAFPSPMPEASSVKITEKESGIEQGLEINTKSMHPTKSEGELLWSELRTKAGKERKRLPLACIACRRKKIRCSGEKPACKHCLRSKIPCVYKTTTRKAAPRTDYMAMLDKRLKRMEERVIKLIPKETQPHVPRAVLKPSSTNHQPRCSGTKRAAADAFGPDLDLEKWSKSRNACKRSGTPVPGKTQCLGEKGLLTEGLDDLPPMEIQRHLAEVYFDFVYGQSYPLLHKPSFMRRLAAGNVAPVLVLAVCAVSARFSNHPKVCTEPAFLRGEDWARVAREIALKRYDTPNITILIVYLLLGLHEFGTCQGGRSWMLAGMAQRMALAMLLHKDLDHDGWGNSKKEKVRFNSTDREIRRRAMWACFLMDRFNASGTDRPMQMTEDFLDIPLPIKENYFEMELSAPTDTLSDMVLHSVESESGQMVDTKQNMGASAYYIHLIWIWGRLVRYWNLGGRQKETHPPWSTHSQFHVLRKSIQSFNAGLPESMKWSTDNLQNHASAKMANQFIFVHLVYNQLVLFMNRFALPHSGFGGPSKDTPEQFLTNAAWNAIEAANQVSLLAREARDHNVTAPFAGYCAFYASTVHILGVFSQNARVEKVSKRYLAYSVQYLSKMKKYWGMFHFVAENLKELYQRHADASRRGIGETSNDILQYGDWFDRYPHGVSRTDYEDPVGDAKIEPGADAGLAQESDLQSVEDFFATLSPPSKAAELRRQARKAKAKMVAQSNTIETADGDETAGPPQPQSPSDQITLQEPLNPDLAPYTNDISVPELSDTELSLVNNTNPLVQPAILSQPDRDSVSSSYTGIDFSAASSIPNPMRTGRKICNGMNDLPRSDNDFTFSSSTVNGDVPDLWNMNFSGMESINYGLSGLVNEASTAWFMPFNLDPPDFGNDGGLSYGGIMNQGGFDFGVMEGAMALDSTTDLGTNHDSRPS